MMGRLILTRRSGEGVTLFDKESGDTIGHVSIAKITTRQVRVAFQFPEDIEIVRDELLEDEPIDGI